MWDTAIAAQNIQLVENPPALAGDSALTVELTKKKFEQYWPQLDGLRTLAFLLVFFHHFEKVADAERLSIPGPVLAALDTLHCWGWIGVDIFFSLSGFLITHILLTEKSRFAGISFKNFFARRALRIWPVYYLVLGFACVAVPLMQSQTLNWDMYREFLLKQGLPFAFFAGNYSLIFALNILVKFVSTLSLPVIFLLAPLWSLAVEEQFYLTWPFLLKVLPSAKSIYRAIAALCLISVAARAGLWYLSSHVLHMEYAHCLYYQATISHLEPLMVGALCAVTVFNFPQMKERLSRWSPLFIIALAGLCTYAVRTFPELLYNTVYNVPVFSVVALGCLLLLVTALVSPTVAKIFGSKWLGVYGRLTYCMYLVHYFCIKMTDRLMAPYATFLQEHHVPHWPATLVVSLALTFAVAFLSWHLLEKHFLKMRKLFNRTAA